MFWAKFLSILRACLWLSYLCLGALVPQPQRDNAPHCAIASLK